LSSLRWPRGKQTLRGIENLMQVRGFYAKLTTQRMDHITIRVPATSANLGPGFDCLGVALALYNYVTVRRAAPTTKDTMVMEAAVAYFRASGKKPFDFDWSIRGDIPRSRGLGSSVTVRLGVLQGLNELDGRCLDQDALYRLCAELEGHPDNAAPAAFGGFTAARPDRVYFRCDIAPELRFVLLIPDAEMETGASRAQLPLNLPRTDAVQSLAHAAIITAAFASKRYQLLRDSFRDWLHEPFREEFNPHLRPAVNAAVAAGALGGYLSGSGSAVCGVTLNDPHRVAGAMQSVVPSARVLVLEADNRGVAVED